eukprot:TRINITY_DN26267_c0_g1_i1.p1 TRINITY_DN26267_c0_g1~~TRINITY_DN26267_c0_g1_i1.p1  ORF type:complete len:301 (-),score=38.73 TRINITY_DN26267_c0_g1_i1:610-1512(-)
METIRLFSSDTGGKFLASIEAAKPVLRNWWQEVSESEDSQKLIFYSLAAAYAIIGLVALVQLIRIQQRVPEYIWTTQKVFHLLNFIVNAVRAVVFFFRSELQPHAPHVLVAVALDLPGILFFTTYTLLVLFWAEIYHQARGLPTDNLRPSFLITNAAIYLIQFGIWGYMWLSPENFDFVDTLSKFFFAGVSLSAATGFLLYGGRLFLMLRRFPIESRGRRKKLSEVGYVTAICFICFSVRAIMIAISAFNERAFDLDVLYHPLLNLVYYTLVELLPSALVLFILRRLPPRRNPNVTQPIR